MENRVPKANGSARAREVLGRQQIVSVILMVIFLLQFVDLPGAIMMHDQFSIGIVMLGLLLCGVAMMFNRMGQITIVSILLILIVDLGCGLMLLNSPMGLDASALSVFDLLVVSELIAVSLLPPISVFPVMASNVIFILGDIMFQKHTMELDMVLKSNMAYNAIVQPISLQVIVAVISFVWVRNALRAVMRADRAEEIAELQRYKSELQQREIEQKHQLDHGVGQLLQTLVQAANGQFSPVSLSQDSILWQVGNSVNLLLTRLRRVNQTEKYVQQLRAEVFHLNQLLHERNLSSSNNSSNPAETSGPPSAPGIANEQKLFNSSGANFVHNSDPSRLKVRMTTEPQ